MENHPNAPSPVPEGQRNGGKQAFSRKMAPPFVTRSPQNQQRNELIT